MSVPRKTDFSEFDDFFPSDGHYLFHENNCSPQVQPHHESRQRFMTQGISPSALFSTSPLVHSYSQPLANSAPITYPITHRNSSWPSKDMIAQSTRNNSFQDGMEHDILHGIDIPGAHASSHHRMTMSPDESFQDAFSMRHVDSHESSFDNAVEQFPMMDETILYSSSPLPFELTNGSGSWGSHMTLSKAMNRTESVLSYGSVFSNEAEIPTSEYQEEIFTCGFDFDMEPPKSPLAIQAIRRVGKVSPAAVVKKGRKRGLSSAEREKTAYIRKIKACQACKSRKLAVRDMDLRLQY
jgi:hypothetical protein